MEKKPVGEGIQKLTPIYEERQMDIISRPSIHFGNIRELFIKSKKKDKRTFYIKMKKRCKERPQGFNVSYVTQVRLAI